MTIPFEEEVAIPDDLHRDRSLKANVQGDLGEIGAEMASILGIVAPQFHQTD